MILGVNFCICILGLILFVIGLIFYLKNKTEVNAKLKFFLSWLLIVPLIGSIPYLLRASNCFFLDNLPLEFMQKGGELIGFSISLVIATFIQIGTNGEEESKELRKNLSVLGIFILVSVVLVKELSLLSEVNPSINQLKVFYASIFTCATAILLNLIVFFKVKKHD